MENDVWIGLANVAPSEGTSIEEFADSAGAYVHALSLALDEDDFAERVGAALSGLELELLELDSVETVVERVGREGLSDHLVALALEAARDGGVELGAFHLYAWEDEDDDEPDVREALAAARDEEGLVRLETAEQQQQGFVVGLGEEWVLLHWLDPSMYLNGYVALPVDELEGLVRLDDDVHFAARALAQQGLRPESRPEIELADLAGLLASACARYPLVSVSRREDATVVGRVVQLGDESFLLRQVSVAGRWEGTGGYRYDDVEKVSFGGRYGEALARVAGEPPA